MITIKEKTEAINVLIKELLQDARKNGVQIMLDTPPFKNEKECIQVIAKNIQGDCCIMLENVQNIGCQLTVR